MFEDRLGCAADVFRTLESAHLHVPIGVRRVQQKRVIDLTTNI